VEVEAAVDAAGADVDDAEAAAEVVVGGGGFFLSVFAKKLANFDAAADGAAEMGEETVVCD